MQDRLKKIRKILNLTQQEFSQKIAVDRSTYAKYETGRNYPPNNIIKLICDTFHVNEKWLRTGEGDPFISMSEYDEIKKLVDEMLVDDSAEMKRRLVSAILHLNAEQISTAVDWIRETFDLDGSDKGSTKKTTYDNPADADTIIAEKVASYRAELEAQASSDKLSPSPTGNAEGA